MTLFQERLPGYSQQIFKQGENQMITHKSLHNNLYQPASSYIGVYARQQVPAGLPNYNNICFLNSILQFLSAASSFKQLLIQKSVIIYGQNMKMSSIMNDIFFYLSQRFNNVLRDNRIKDLISILEKINISYQANRFEDALQTLMNMLNMIQEQDSSLTRCFNIQFQNRCKCVSQIFEAKYIQFSQEQCSSCGQKIKRQNLNFAKYLIYLNYKRIKPTYQRVESIQINGKSTNMVYKLISSINFHGHQYYGHYTATRKQKNKWFHFNDSFVRQASNYDILSENGCILLYEISQSQNAQISIESEQVKQKMSQTKTFPSNNVLFNRISSQNNSFYNLFETKQGKQNVVFSQDIIQLQKTYIFRMEIISSITYQFYYRCFTKKTKFIDIKLKISRPSTHPFSYFIDIYRDLFHDKSSQLQLNFTLSNYLTQKQKIQVKQLHLMIQQHLNKNIEKKFPKIYLLRQSQQFRKKLQKQTSEQFICNECYLFYNSMC